MHIDIINKTNQRSPTVPMSRPIQYFCQHFQGSVGPVRLKIRQSSIWLWYAGSLGQLSYRPSIWWSKYYFDRLKMKQWVAGLDLEHSKLFARNTWNIKRLVHETIVPSTQQPSALFWRLSDFKPACEILGVWSTTFIMGGSLSACP